jgi:DNA-binding IclR family transcriptional regulator
MLVSAGAADDSAEGPRSVHRALMLLTEVTAHGPLTLSELSKRVGLSASTAMRLLRALSSWGYVERDELNQYRPGMRWAHTPPSVPATPDLIESAGPVLKELTARTRESSYLSVRSGPDSLVYLRQVHSPEAIRHVDWAGRTMPLGSTAAGRALRGDTDSDGVALAEAIATEGATAVAAPVTDDAGAIVAALSIVGPSFRLRGDALRACETAVREAALDLSATLQGPSRGAAGARDSRPLSRGQLRASTEPPATSS